MKVLLRASFNRYSGYGNDAVDIALWLSRAGVDVYPMVTSLIGGLPQEFTDLLTKKPRMGHHAYDATLQFLPPFYIRVSDGLKKNVRDHGVPKAIAPIHYGWSMWEQSKLLPKDMRGHGIGAHPWRLLDVMYVTTRMNIEAFKHYDKRPEYRLMPCGIDPTMFPVMKRPMTGPTRFCMVGELHQRKDPFVAIEAFRELKQEKGDAFDAELNLKTVTPGLHPKLSEWQPGINVIHEMWEWEKLIQWYGTQHVYLAPSRGEGNHKPPMEFMATGGTVIATNWSGPENWLHTDVAYPLDYKLMPVHGDPEGSLSARADKEHLKQLMWHVHTNRQEAIKKGMLAAEWIRQTMAWPKLIGKLIRQIEDDLR